MKTPALAAALELATCIAMRLLAIQLFGVGDLADVSWIEVLSRQLNLDFHEARMRAFGD